MRVAWIGLAPVEDSGTSYIATQLLRELTAAGVEIDCYAATSEETIHPTLHSLSGLRFICEPSRWQRDQWYSRSSLGYHLSLQVMRIMAQARLAKSIVVEHQRRPYDVLYHFSQIELFALRRYRRQLPPIVVHPNAHAAGELRWHRREKTLARKGESLPRFLAVRAMLRFRAVTQRRDLRVIDHVLVPSRIFASELSKDYLVPRSLVHVVPNPIDLGRFTVGAVGPPAADEPVRLLIVTRISVRKGVELIVELSHRLADLAGHVEIAVVGIPDQWSDYRHLLDDLHPGVAHYLGGRPATEVAAMYRTAHGLLQPSHYEPFALTVGEAIASGLPVVASDAVGAAEDVDRRCCAIFPAGDINAFEKAVRELIDRIRAGSAAELAPLARAEAERLWDPTTIAAQVRRELESVLGQGIQAR